MNLQEAPILICMVTCALPVAAVLLRPVARFLRIATLVVALSAALFLFALLRILLSGPATFSDLWVMLLTGSGVPLMLGGYVLTLGIGRERPETFFRRARRALSLLALVGGLSLLLLHRDSFVSGYDWDVRGTVHLGSLGKAYLSYLLVGIVLMGYNIECTYRTASSSVRHLLRPPFLALFGLLGFLTFILTSGLLYSSVGLGKLVALCFPAACANVAVAYGLMRRALIDAAAPVSRRVIYTSFTAVAAGLYVLAVGVVAQVATFTHWSPDEVVTLSIGFLAVLLAVLLLLSNRFQRRMRRFIDSNFYVNRYDYRTQWSNVTRAMESVIETDSVLEKASEILKDLFMADAVTIALRDEASMAIRPCMGRGSGDPQLVIEEGSPLATLLATGRRALLLDRRPDDFEYIGIYAENRAWLDGTASQIVTPLLDGDRLTGCLGLQRNRERDPFTYEDVALLESVSFHIASRLQAARHAQELTESREMNLISQWSSMLLHDLKNYLAPLRLVAQNLVQYQNTPGIAELAASDIGRVTDRMETLVRTLSELRDNPHRSRQRVDLNDLVRSTLREMHVERRQALKVHLDLDGDAAVLGDEGMMQRVLENLVNNAIEAMNGAGTLTIETRSERIRSNGAKVHVAVRDTGSGIPPEFLRERLFRPFATTKKGGLGLGLYQCRSIVRAHGGELKVESKLGVGTSVQIIMDALAPDPDIAVGGPLPRTPGSVVV